MSWFEEGIVEAGAEYRLFDLWGRSKAVAQMPRKFLVI